MVLDEGSINPFIGLSFICDRVDTEVAHTQKNSTYGFYILILKSLGFSAQVFSSCPAACSCTQELPKCAPGVSLVSDGCGCCKVCARQLNEDCSKTEPCDHTKGLECNFGASHGATRGICRGMFLITLCERHRMESMCG